MNTSALAENIATDLEQGLPKALVIQYWSAKQNIAQESPQRHDGRHRAVAASPVSDDDRTDKRIDRIRRANGSKIIDALAVVAEGSSYNSIARAIYGDSFTTSRAFKVRKWCLGLQGASARSVEVVRTFLIELAEGKHQDVLKRPGGNRRV